MCAKVGELWDFPDLPQPAVLFLRSGGSAHHYSISATCWLRRETAAITAPTAGGADKKPLHENKTFPPSARSDTRFIFLLLLARVTRRAAVNAP